MSYLFARKAAIFTSTMLTNHFFDSSPSNVPPEPGKDLIILVQFHPTDQPIDYFVAITADNYLGNPLLLLVASLSYCYIVGGGKVPLLIWL
jgi:hypothetical protein